MINLIRFSLLVDSSFLWTPYNWRSVSRQTELDVPIHKLEIRLIRVCLDRNKRLVKFTLIYQAEPDKLFSHINLPEDPFYSRSDWRFTEIYLSLSGRIWQAFFHTLTSQKIHFIHVPLKQYFVISIRIPRVLFQEKTNVIFGIQINLKICPTIIGKRNALAVEYDLKILNKVICHKYFS